MWRPPINFITVHYAWIIFAGILGLIAIYPYGNLAATDAYFLSASASTESGLNTVDLKDLKTYQQVVLYLLPIFTHLGFINIIVVLVRLHWFEKHLKKTVPLLLRANRHNTAGSTGLETDVEAQGERLDGQSNAGEGSSRLATEARRKSQGEEIRSCDSASSRMERLGALTLTPQLGYVEDRTTEYGAERSKPGGRITIAQNAKQPQNDSRALYIPSPRERDRGRPIVEQDTTASDDEDEDPTKAVNPGAGLNGLTRRRAFQREGPSLSTAKSFEQVAVSMFILGASRNQDKHRSVSCTRSADLPYLSRDATVGRNSQFYNLTNEDRERLGGIEYRSLKLLLNVISCYFFGLHIFGALCLLVWVHNAPSKYSEWLQVCGQSKTWWAFYSSQTMISNMGYTLTPDSMVTFRDASWPMVLMTFLTFAGNTCYPVFLRLTIWTISKLAPKRSSLKEPLQFLLDHPRRCYTLLFLSRPTWVLFGILFVMNFVDVLLIITLDLNNPEVNELPLAPRVLAAIFQAASTRHTGAATFNLAEVNPAVQFSLVVMMYISALPIAISIRSSNTYEEKTLGIYGSQHSLDESNGSSYVMMHVQNQLGFDLWYIFLGTFCVCVAESAKIMDRNEPAFTVFAIFFEVVSGYGNVGLSLGHPSVTTSLSGKFTVFAKLVLCAIMIRGRHRGLPYALDRAITLPGERLGEGGSSDQTRPPPESEAWDRVLETSVRTSYEIR